MRNPENPRATTYTDTVTLFENNPHLIVEANGWDYRTIKTTSRTLLSWICKEGHVWESNLGNRVGKKSGCPYCAGKAVLAGFNDLGTLNPEIASMWHEKLNGHVGPNQIALLSHKKYWWTCDSNHSFEQNVYHMVIYKSCLVCTGKKLVSGVNDFKTLYPDVAKQWDYEKNKNLLPEKIKPKDGRKAWWICEIDNSHSWQSRISDRSYGMGCAVCNSSGFRESLPSTFYIISNESYLAGKVGITNNGNRLRLFESKGWKIEKTFFHEDGRKIRQLETKVLQWIRKDNKIPAYLTRKEMLHMGGQYRDFLLRDATIGFSLK